ncbi:hypothetical protein [uncultured Lamprocystis sp.]|uniref:hypothetical protein n=2 Tax=uncultured Lamprocystis sp. TaxID=543132 RepID=UPI0025CBC00E|nr:hypothetical protein [uncultured Lamprocystis sp.]
MPRFAVVEERRGGICSTRIFLSTTMAVPARDHLPLLAGLGNERCHLYGHSTGDISVGHQSNGYSRGTMVIAKAQTNSTSGSPTTLTLGAIGATCGRWPRNFARAQSMHVHQKIRPSLYEQLEALPEGLTGEIHNGQIYRVPYSWLLDPVAHLLEADALEDGVWREIGRFAGAAAVSAAPFEAVTIRLDDLWAPTE